MKRAEEVEKERERETRTETETENGRVVKRARVTGEAKREMITPSPSNFRPTPTDRSPALSYRRHPTHQRVDENAGLVFAFAVNVESGRRQLTVQLATRLAEKRGPRKRERKGDGFVPYRVYLYNPAISRREFWHLYIV